MPRKPFAAENQSRRPRAKARRTAAPSGVWRPPPLAWILHAGQPELSVPVPVRLLSATLPEAFLLASGFKDADVVALESDGDRVKSARAAASRRRLRNLRIERAALDQPALGELVGGNFDAILAHETLHAVSDIAAAWANLSAAVSPEGSVYASLRTPAHPAARLTEAMEAFGLEAESSDEAASEVRRFLAALGGFLTPTDLLRRDGKNPHPGPSPLSWWLDHAAKAGLHPRVCGLTAAALPAALGAGHTGLLGSFTLPRMLILLDRFLGPASVGIVFSRKPSPEPPWRRPDNLAAWRPLCRFLPLHKLQPFSAPWEAAAAVTIEIPGLLGSQSFTLSRYLLELLRRSNGLASLGDLMSEIPHEGRLVDLAGGLHFLHHAFIMELLPPATGGSPHGSST